MVVDTYTELADELDSLLACTLELLSLDAELEASLDAAELALETELLLSLATLAALLDELLI